MKTLCKISLISITLILLFVSSTTLAATENNTGNATIKDNYVSSAVLTTTEKSDLPKTNETQITTSGLVMSPPAIYGDKIVWSARPNVDLNISVHDDNIYMYDLSTKKKTQITTDGRACCPAIYGNRIVWKDECDEDNKYDIYMYDLSTKKEIPIAIHDENKGTSSGDGLAIYGDKIVWASSYDGEYRSSQIYIYDLSTKKETKITTNESDNIQPAIYGNKIVYSKDNEYLSEDSSGDFDIYIYDLSTKKETRIATNTNGLAFLPAIHGDRIVWRDFDAYNGSDDIYMYDLSTKKQTLISGSGSVDCPSVYGDRVVWQDGDLGNYSIYVYNISTNQKIKINNNGSAIDPHIYGNNVVWRYHFGNIYIRTVP